MLGANKKIKYYCKRAIIGGFIIYVAILVCTADALIKKDVDAY